VGRPVARRRSDRPLDSETSRPRQNGATTVPPQCLTAEGES
jgi:hypothetical protein